MRKMLVLGLVGAAMALAGFTGVAQAVPSPGYCGGSATADRLVHHGPPTEWVYTYSSNCGVDKWVRIDLQNSTVNNGGWTTQDFFYVQTPAADANHWVQTTIDNKNAPVTCSNSLWWTMKVTWRDGIDRTPAWKGQC